jgi:chromosome segregation ATPase
VKEKVDLAMPNRSKESNNQSPVQKRRKEILDELGQIRQKQAGFKNARSNRTDQIKRLDEQLKSRIAEQKTARSKVPYKSLEELDNHVRDLNRKVESGSLKLVDEKKALNEISAATRMRKTFTQFDESQKAVDELKAKIKEVKDSGDDPEQRQLSERYTVLQTELDAIKAQSDEAHKNIKSLLAEKDQLNAEQKQSYAAMKKLKDDFYAQKRAHRQFEEEQKQKGRERFRAERERQIQERKKADAERFLEEASNPAFMEEIRRANSLLQFLDPSTRSTEKAPLLADKGLAAQAQRKVDDAGMKGMKLVQKKERDEEYLPAATKKGKKGKKSTGAAEKQKFIIPPSALEDCAFLGVEAPIKSEDIPAVIEKVNEKLASWKENQEAETRKVSASCYPPRSEMIGHYQGY